MVISIHALLAESDDIRTLQTLKMDDFYPRSPCGERRCSRCQGSRWTANFYPRSPCGERLECLPYPVMMWMISIHALLAESDICSRDMYRQLFNFYPRSPCGERPGKNHRLSYNHLISIHALLAESDNDNDSNNESTQIDFYPRSPCGERQFNAKHFACLCNFYPRSPCGERPSPKSSPD